MENSATRRIRTPSRTKNRHPSSARSTSAFDSRDILSLVASPLTYDTAFQRPASAGLFLCYDSRTDRYGRQRSTSKGGCFGHTQKTALLALARPLPVPGNPQLTA